MSYTTNSIIAAGVDYGLWNRIRMTDDAMMFEHIDSYIAWLLERELKVADKGRRHVVVEVPSVPFSKFVGRLGNQAPRVVGEMIQNYVTFDDQRRGSLDKNVKDAEEVVLRAGVRITEAMNRITTGASTAAIEMHTLCSYEKACEKLNEVKQDRDNRNAVAAQQKRLYK